MNFTILYLIGALIIVIALFVIAFWKQYRKVGPNEALIISGGRKRTVTDPDGTVRKVGYRVHIGGGTFVIPIIEKVQVLPLEVISLEVETPEVYTLKGVPILASGIAQVKIGGDETSIRTAAEQFVERGVKGIQEVAHQIIEGHVRSVIGTMSIEEIYKGRAAFAVQVTEHTEKDFSKLGLNLLSFNLKDIKDTQGYLESLGKPKIAEAKRDAVIAEAETERDAIIHATDAKKEGNVAKIKAEMEVAAATREYESKKADGQVTVNQSRAKADLAYDLERQKVNQLIKTEEYKVKIIEKEKGIELEEKEILRRERELESSIKKPADARKYQVITEAEGESYRLKTEAEGKAEADRMEGLVVADLMKTQGTAEAEAMHKKADAWKTYNQAAIFEMLVNILPDMARAVSEPLSKVEKIVMVHTGGDGGSLGASKITGEVANVLAQLPTVVESLSGIDVKKLIEKLPRIGEKAGSGDAEAEEESPSKKK